MNQLVNNKFQLLLTENIYKNIKFKPFEYLDNFKINFNYTYHGDNGNLITCRLGEYDTYYGVIFVLRFNDKEYKYYFNQVNPRTGLEETISILDYSVPYQLSQELNNNLFLEMLHISGIIDTLKLNDDINLYIKQI